MAAASDADHVPPSVDPIRVLLVDDSGVIRSFLRRFVEADPELKVMGTAANGERAVAAVRDMRFDVVVLDIEMPVMDGVTALPLIFEADPHVQVIIASTLTKANAILTMKCLEAGAAECLTKPNAQEMALGAGAFRQSLVEKVKTLGIVGRRKRGAAGTPLPAPRLPEERAQVPLKTQTAFPLVRPAAPPKSFSLRQELVKMGPEAIAIGSSTGGPQALLQFFSSFNIPFRQPVFITQHMPPTFTTILAEHISQQSKLMCREAVNGEEVKGGVIYLAPGNYHMTVRAEGTKKTISLNQGPPENFCRPAADPMLRSLVDVYGRRVLAVILTGMGSDGLKGCQQVVEAGGTVLAQDEASSVVWGMPGAVALAGLCTQVLPLSDLAREVQDYARRLGGA